MAQGGIDRKAEKSYLSSAVDSINPWGGPRSATPTPRDPQPASPAVAPADHTLNHLYGQSFKKYPSDCPPLNVQWFHAVDIPKRKPKFLKGKLDSDDTKPGTPPKKFVAFSPEDSKSIEDAYQKALEDLEDIRGNPTTARAGFGTKRTRREASIDLETSNTNIEGVNGGVRVPVNEDFLFDVDLEQRELAPAYWLGPIYEVRRGSWFYQDGLRPCEENLAAQLEEGYLKLKPWQYPAVGAAARARSNSAVRDVTPKPSVDNLKGTSAVQADSAIKPSQPQSYRLFGTWMNNAVTYQDATTAYLTSEGMLSWVTSTMYERFVGPAYMGGVKLVRGYSEAKKAKEAIRPSTPTGTKSTAAGTDERENVLRKRLSAPPTAASDTSQDKAKEAPTPITETRTSRLTRQLSSLLESSESRNAGEQAEEELRKREEEEIQDDYNPRLGETQGREIEHLVLITHGIGQLLGLRMESVNFVHDVNVMRKTLKQVYSTSDDLRAFNSELEQDGPGNCRVQVLPVCWRHLLDFPKRKEKKNERDLGETVTEEDEYPSLEDITVEGVAFARSLISDLALDVLLYQSAYRELISEIVVRESNRIYKLFKDRNPEFRGKVHVMGHSLGSAIMFDILCRQKEKPKPSDASRNPLRFWPSPETVEPKDPKELCLDFEVEDFYCLGSPVGLFQMLKGRTIAGRHHPHALPSESPFDPEYIEDPFLTSPISNADGRRISPITNLPFTVSSPKAAQLFNVFHPSDPIAYRLEPLISPAMSSLKPQALPYTKKGIFGAVAPQGLTGIGAKVGQSVSGLWSSLSAGIASSLLNRSLGLTSEDVANITASAQQQALSPGAGTNITAGGVISPESALSDVQRAEKAAERKRQLADQANASGSSSGSGGATSGSLSGNDATLLDDELETLFSQFQKKRIDLSHGDRDNETDVVRTPAERAAEHDRFIEEENKAHRLRREEMKVRALNRNGRVDYNIQESVLDFNPINTIASHMSYWADEDVIHFIMSQLLSNKARTKRL